MDTVRNIDAASPSVRLMRTAQESTSRRTRKPLLAIQRRVGLVGGIAHSIYSHALPSLRL